jgi:polyisoprenoid-binding protein YceI
MTLSRTARALALGLVLSAGLGAGSALAACAGLPPGVKCGVKDAQLAPAGAYALDRTHASILAMVSHIGYSRSAFRFGDASGTLVWDPAAPVASKLSVVVKTASIATPVKGFAEELQGEKYLNSSAFADATFVSTAFRPIDDTHGQVDGVFTLMGKSKPVTFDVALAGAGPGFGKPRLGVTAHGWINPQDFGFASMFSDPIELILDVEFVKAG